MTVVTLGDARWRFSRASRVTSRNSKRGKSGAWELGPTLEQAMSTAAERWTRCVNKETWEGASPPIASPRYQLELPHDANKDMSSSACLSALLGTIHTYLLIRAQPLTNLSDFSEIDIRAIRTDALLCEDVSLEAKSVLATVQYGHATAIGNSWKEEPRSLSAEMAVRPRRRHLERDRLARHDDSTRQ